MNSAGTDIKDIIVGTSSLGLVFGTNLFIGQEPVTPDNCVTIFDTMAMKPTLTMDNDEVFNLPSLQIRVRNNSYVTGWQLIHDITDTLRAWVHSSINGTLYDTIVVSSGPGLLDWDENGRVCFIVNLDITRR